MPHRWAFWLWNWHALLPRAAAAAVMMAAIGFTIIISMKLTTGASSLPKMSRSWRRAQPLPSVDVLQNFDAIQRMSQPAHADEELLALASDLK